MAEKTNGNPPGLFRDLEFYFRDRGQPDFGEPTPPDHGRIETRKIWITTELNGYLAFPHLGQAFLIERQRTEKKNGQPSVELAYGLTSRTPPEAGPERVLKVNCGQWAIESAPTCSTGTTMKTTAVSRWATARKISPACAASPSA